MWSNRSAAGRRLMPTVTRAFARSIRPCSRTSGRRPLRLRRDQLLRALGDLLARCREKPGVGMESEHLVADVVPLLGDLGRAAHDAGRHLVLSGGLCDSLDHAPVAGIPALVA